MLRSSSNCHSRSIKRCRRLISAPGSRIGLRAWVRSSVTSLLSLVMLSSCEIPTKLVVRGGNPPSFQLSGNGLLTSFRVRGPRKQRDAEGEDASMYWMIKRSDGQSGDTVSRIGTIVYGELPRGYRNIYPETGQVPQLEEGERYYVEVITADAEWASAYFTIEGGKAVQEP